MTSKHLAKLHELNQQIFLLFLHRLMLNEDNLVTLESNHRVRLQLIKNKTHYAVKLLKILTIDNVDCFLLW